MIEAFMQYERAVIIKWRKAINDYMLRTHGYEFKFYPEIEGEEE